MFPPANNLTVKIRPARAGRIFAGNLSAGRDFSGWRSYNGPGGTDFYR